MKLYRNLYSALLTQIEIRAWTVLFFINQWTLEDTDVAGAPNVRMAQDMAQTRTKMDFFGIRHNPYPVEKYIKLNSKPNSQPPAMALRPKASNGNRYPSVLRRLGRDKVVFGLNSPIAAHPTNNQNKIILAC
jgi:hypothetical protein